MSLVHRFILLGILFLPIRSFCQPPELDLLERLIQSKKFDSAEIVYPQIHPLLSSLDSISIGKVYFFYHDLLWDRKQFDSAVSLNQAAGSFLQNSPFWTGQVLKQQSKDHLLQGNYDAAIADAQEASELFEALDDTLEYASCLSALSNIYHDIFQYQSGIEYGHKSLELLLAHSVGSPDYLAYAMNCIAINHDDNGEHEEAIKWHKRVIDEVMPHMQIDYNKTRTFNNIGNSYMKLGNYEEAIKYLRYNLELETKTGRKFGLATVNMNLGILSYLNKDFETSQRYMNRSEALAFEIQAVEKIHDVLFQQYMLYKHWGKFEKSLAYLERFQNFKDSLMNETKSRQWLELQTKYETSIKEKEIADQKTELAKKDLIIERDRLMMTVLVASIVLIVLVGLLVRGRMKLVQQKQLEIERSKLKETQIEAALNSQEIERRRFARDLHDGFGQMISVLNLNLKSLEKGDVSREAIFENSSKVLDDMYRELKGICFNLMPETLIKNGVVDALKEFASRINYSGKVSVAIDSFGITERLPDLAEINLYRISQEWINNVLKYSDATKISLQITRDESEITLMIEDDGSGFEKTLLIDGKGNGWKNIQSRTNLLKGEVELDTRSGSRGNTLILNIPVEILEKELAIQA